MFPVLNDPIIKALPWHVLQPHEAQALHNHGQSLNRLAQRGGLSIEESYYILRDEAWPRDSERQGAHAVRISLMQMVAEFYATIPPREAV